MNLAIVIVAHDEGDDIARLLDALAEQRIDGDEVVVAHNTSDRPLVHRTAEVARSHPGVDRLIETGGNLGFGHAANRGAEATRAETLLFLNPDTVPEPGCLDALRRPPDGWDGWMGLVTLEDGERVNTAGGVAHFLGFGWVGRYLEPASTVDPQPHEVGFLSGACLAIRRPVWDAIGGFPELFFVYVEDLDISLRLKLAGHRYGVLPDARLRHGYEFGGRAWKLMEIEKNRWLMIVRCYPAPLLWLVLPALLLLEPAMLAYAAANGWGGAKLEAIQGFLRGLPQALRERREVQRLAAVGPAEFGAILQPELDSPLLGAVGRSRLVRLLLRGYWAVVRAALGRAG